MPRHILRCGRAIAKVFHGSSSKKRVMPPAHLLNPIHLPLRIERMKGLSSLSLDRVTVVASVPVEFRQSNTRQQRSCQIRQQQ